MTKQDRANIKELLLDPKWPSVKQAFEEFVLDGQMSGVVGDNEFETVRKSVEHDMYRLVTEALEQRLEQEASRASVEG